MEKTEPVKGIRCLKFQQQTLCSGLVHRYKLWSQVI